MEKEQLKRIFDFLEEKGEHRAPVKWKLINNIPTSYSSPFTAKVPMTPYCVPPTTINCTPNPRTNPPRGF